MKKNYIRPKVTCHHVEVESQLLAASLSDEVKLYDEEVDDDVEQY